MNDSAVVFLTSLFLLLAMPEPVRRQSSTAGGGGGGAEKMFGGKQINFSLKFGSEVQKNGLHSKLRPVDPAVQGTIRTRGSTFVA